MSAAANAEAEVRSCLRFLTKDARLPLAEAMQKINALRKLRLATPEQIAQASSADLKIVFTDEKVLKQVISAAKRVSNPRKKGAATSQRQAKVKAEDPEDEETAYTLPVSEKTEDELMATSIETNRAPLFLAFTVSVLAYTYPEQPLSSRLSLAQAVVSAGAQSKARHIGLSNEPTAEEDGWAAGQPKLKIMGRNVAVMRRHRPSDSTDGEAQPEDPKGADASHTTYWGLDLEALRKSNGPLIRGDGLSRQTRPPIHTAKAARSYLVRSMNTAVDHSPQIKQEAKPSKPHKETAAEIAARKEEAAAMVLKAIDIALGSWKDTLSAEELDRRAQNWYAMVRPEVAAGKEGWGQRGTIHLKDILKFTREP